MKTKYIDNEEKLLIESLNNLDLDSIENDTNNIKILRSSAKKFIKQKETKMNRLLSKLCDVKRWNQSALDLDKNIRRTSQII